MALDYIEYKDISGSIAGSLIGTAKDAIVATGADFVSTLFNSTVGLFTDDIKTRDLLTKVDKNALAFYDEHKDGVEMASFISGIVAPQAVTMKLLGMAKNGVTSLGKSNALTDVVGSTFSGKRAKALEDDLRVMFENAKYDTTEYRNTMYKLYATKVGENTIDAMIFEAITIGTLSAHPYMEDYMESPISNFTLWAGVGGIAGGALGSIAANSAVRRATADIATKATTEVFGGVVPVDLSTANTVKIQQANASIKNLDALIKSDTNEYTKALASSVLTSIRGQREELIMDAAPFLRPIKTATGQTKESEFIYLKPYVEEILGDPKMFGVDKIKLPNMNFIPKGKGSVIEFDVDMLKHPGIKDPKVHKEYLKLMEQSKDFVEASKKATDVTESMNLLQKHLDVELKIKEILVGTKDDLRTVFYRPSTKELFDRDLAGASARAVDLKDLRIQANTVNLYDPGADFFLNNLAKADASAKIDAQYLQELNAWKNVKPSQIKNIAIAPDNLARLAGAIAWQSKQTPELLESLAYNLRSDLPSYTQAQKFVESGAAGVRPDYWEKVDALANNDTISLMGRLGRSEASGMLSGWKAGDTSTLRRAFDAFFRGTSLPAAERGNAEIARQIWNAGANFRQELSKHADKDGFIYLYRGLRDRIKGHAPVEGYTTSLRVASAFGSARLHKIHVDNVIGRIGGSSYSSEIEILVGAPHQQIVNNLPISTADNIPVNIPNSGSVNTVNGIQLVQHYTAETERQIRAMAEAGNFSFEEIASRTNTTKEIAQLVTQGKSLADIPNWQRYSNPDLIQTEYLNKKNRILALQGNKYAVNPIVMMGNLDDRMMSVAHQQLVEWITAKHGSSLADDILNIYAPINDPMWRKNMMLQLEQLKQNLGEVNNALVGSPTFQSVDNAIRHIKNGPLVTFLGKRVSDTTDAAIKRVLTPVSDAYKGLGAKQTALIEYSAAHTKLQSLQGWKDIRIDPENGFGYIVQRKVAENGKEIVEEALKNADGSVYYIKQKEVLHALDTAKSASEELLRLHNVNREIRGLGPLNDLGLYLPPPSLVNKYYSYVIDQTGKNRPATLIANTAEELAGLEAAYKAEIISKNPSVRIVSKSEQEAFNLTQRYLEGEPYVTVANNQLRHGGSIASAIVPADARLIEDVMQSYEQQIIAGMRKYNEMYLHDITSKLDVLSRFNQRLQENQPLRGFFKEKNVDAAQTVKNALLGVNNLNQTTTWKGVNELVDMLIVKAGKAVDTTNNVFRKKLGTQEHFDALVAELKKEGITNPWENFQVYQASLLGADTVNSKRVVAAANGLMGTFMLRFLEMAHPLVNALSLPILGSAAVMEGLPGVELPNGQKMKFPLAILMDAMRFQNNPHGKQMIDMWNNMGLNNQVIRQFTDITGKLHVPAASKGAANELIGSVERLQNSDLMSLLSKPSDFVEVWSRQMAMSTGYLMAKTAYKGIDDLGATIYATTIADRMIGNYHAAQRPTMFQGTAGAVLGLFQTYMLTYAQSVFRQIEAGQFRNLAAMMLAQAGIFGTASLPGYDLLSKAIGLHMSNENYDLTTGTYRGVGDPMASVILYGLPSNLGPALYTRGDIAPRIPNELGDLAVANTMMGVYNATTHMVGNLVNQPTMEGKLQGMMEAISLQTLSRPIARTAEIIAGESITKKGHTVSTSDEVWTFNGVFSRLLSTRPLEEQVLRNTLHLNSFYGAADNEARQKVVNQMRIAIRAGNLTDDLISSTALDYFRKGGSAKGWASAMNEIMARTEEGTSYDLMRKLEPNSPLRLMIQDTF